MVDCSVKVPKFRRFNALKNVQPKAMAAVFAAVFAGIVADANIVQAQQPAANQQTANQQTAQQRPAGQPFAPLTPQQQAQLDQLLLAWQQQSQSMKTLECNFTRWEYDTQRAPGGLHWKKATGNIKYATPDRGLFLDQTVNVFQGMKDGKPQYGPSAEDQGDYWVCTGKEVHSYDRSKKKCTILELPADMQGKEIFNSPLPFVFNLDAEKIKQRYWVRSMPVEQNNTYLIEAWPKTQQDRAQYKLVQIALNQAFEPVGLVMYAPNFHPKHAAEWDHYEFNSVKRNAIGAGFQKFFGAFVPQRVPMGWEIDRKKIGQEQVAQQPAASGPQRQ